ncbi:family 43 glycosylhydrolase [Streptacidiphilus rugosus]|uniref:family 43 glycosylhydrolase n=1 Tax=Streptacidiphilus rugosus TaxID=405783 RepID=UPI000691943C|nr:family 43 glycosylhydrolase [Streptacidiphilus rugosus]
MISPAHRSAAAGTSTTWVNLDPAGHAVTRYDTAGNAVDAHDGTTALFNGTYYLYGTSYDCGYQLNTKFCGFKVYSSPDLAHWTDRGYAVSGSACTVCFRPHVIYNISTAKYVMWANVGSGYRVYLSSTPTGPFVAAGDTTLTMTTGQSGGDEGLFVDSDRTAYLAYTVITQSTNSHEQRIEKLNSQYTGGTGQYADIPRTDAASYPPYGTEAPSLFLRGATYYSVMGPTCPYCAGTPTLYATAPSPLGPWSTYTAINADSCGGQPSFVFPLTEGTTAATYAPSTTYLFGSDLWHASATGALEPNQALANYYWAPLQFDDTTDPPAIKPFTCAAEATVALPSGSPGNQSATPGGVDQTSSDAGFHTWCDIRQGTAQREQTFVAGRSGILDRLSLTVFQRNQRSATGGTLPMTGPPNAPLVLDLLDVGANRTLASMWAADAGTLGWSPRAITVQPNAAVSQGHSYAVVLRSATTTGCYGFAYSDAAPYAGGGEAYSTNGGTTYTTESNRSLKFWTAVGPAGATFCGSEGGYCNFSGTQQVSFGAGGSYVSTTVAGPVACNPTTFGSDPSPGVIKACYVHALGPAGDVMCAVEQGPGSPNGAGCNFNGTQQVSFGAGGNFLSKTLSGPVTCSSSTFGGDPAVGTVKACFVQPLVAGAPPGYTLCAPAESGVCTFTGVQSLAYGADGDYTFTTRSGPVACDLASFDDIDPAYGTVKACYIGPPRLG